MAASGKIHRMSALTPKPFREPVGTKTVWLPNFTLTLLRNPNLPPNFAQFIVPLSMNKLDIKDYLWNAYGVPVTGVRSFIQQSRVQRFKQGPGRAMWRRWHRPRSIKKMIVEMGKKEDGPGGKGGGYFVWPDELTEEELEQSWDKKVYDEAQKQQDAQNKSYSADGVHLRYEAPGKKTLAEQARDLREGKVKWQPTWADIKQANENR